MMREPERHAGEIPLPPGAIGWNVYSGSTLIEFAATLPPGCDVYWGSHGCGLPGGHDPAVTPHACDCCECKNHPDPYSGCVARPPYYGAATRFYGDDAPDCTWGEIMRRRALRSAMRREYRRRTKAGRRRRA